MARKAPKPQSASAKKRAKKSGPGSKPSKIRAKVFSAGGALQTLHSIVADALTNSTDTSPRGACRYQTTAGPQCAYLTESYCQQLQGEWTEGASCP